MKRFFMVTKKKRPAIKIATVILMAGLFLLPSCAKNSLSERDAKKEQLKSSAETKRKELQIIAGEFNGVLTPGSGVEQNTTLFLEIKDIPTTVEGQVDPILVPTLKGFLRFNLGSGGNNSEFIGYSVEKADFDPKRNRLDLVVSNATYKDIILACDLNGTSLKGTWTAPSTASSGTIALDKTQVQSGSIADQLRGEYGGTLLHDAKSLYQFGQLTLSTSILPPEGLKVSATVRIIYGALGSTEYLTYRFDPVQFNPINGQIVFKSETNDVMFTGHWSKGVINGEWYSNYTGRLGNIFFKKDHTPEPQSGSLFEALKGTYQGKLTNTNSQSNLPERMMISFVTAQDLSKPNGISVTGSLRLYMGPFGSNEYVEYAFSDVQFNFFTRYFTAKTSDNYKLTLKAEAKLNSISGTISADALGEVGTFEVKKQ